MNNIHLILPNSFQVTEVVNTTFDGRSFAPTSTFYAPATQNRGVMFKAKEWACPKLNLLRILNPINPVEIDP